jgi:hypothetical protein
MDVDIKPEPTPEERQAILEALAAEAEVEHELSAWQRAALEFDDERD